MTQLSFPFPERDGMFEDVDIYSYKHLCRTFEEYDKQYQRKISKEASSIKNQYLSIEEEILTSFQYVNPACNNLHTTSARFATIVRESCNLFELISRATYNKLFSNNGRINIKNFLSLDFFLDLRDAKTYSPILFDELKDTDLFQPFKSLEQWNKNSIIHVSYIPRWWTAYNKLKHDINGINTYATLENALLSIGAVYLLISKIYGDGVVGGILLKPLVSNSFTTNFTQQLVPVSKLFIEVTTMISVAVFG